MTILSLFFKTDVIIAELPSTLYKFKFIFSYFNNISTISIKPKLEAKISAVQPRLFYIFKSIFLLLTKISTILQLQPTDAYIKAELP